MYTFDLVTSLAIILLSVVALALGIHYRRSVRRDGREMNDELEDRVQTGPEIVDADPTEFYWLDRDFYDRTRDQLEALGFRTIGDFENLTETRVTPYLRRFSRLMVNHDGTAQANIVMFRPLRRKMPLRFIWIPVSPRRLISLSSQTVDGVRLLTANAEGVLAELDLPGLVSQYFPPETPVADLYMSHRAAMDVVLQSDPKMPFKSCRTREDVLRFSREEHEWMKACDAYHKVAVAATRAQAQHGEDMENASRDILNAYLHERERRRAMMDQLSK